MADSFTQRQPAGGGGIEKILVHQADDLTQDPTGNANRRVAEVFAWRGHPAQFQRIVPLVGVAAAGEFPADGDGLLRAGSTTTSLHLDPTNATAENVIGCLVLMQGGAAVGDVRRIVDYNTSTRILTTNRALSATPATNDPYVLLVDCLGRSQLVIKSEFEDSTTSATLYPVFYDFPRDPTNTGGDAGLLGLDTTKRTARRYFGRQIFVSPITTGGTITVGAEQSGYFHASVLSEDCRGAIGAKVRLHVVPGASKKVTLWCAAA